MTDEAAGGRRCPWCEAPAGADDTRCPACGAALAQREDLGGLLIPGVTAVEPGLADLADRPMHLRAASPSQGVAPMLAAGALMGGPIGIVALAGAGGVVAAEWMGARGSHPDAPAFEDVGRSSEVARELAERLDREERAAATAPVAAITPGSADGAAEARDPENADPEAAPAPGPSATGEPDPAPSDRDPWPLPPPPPWRG